MVKFQEEKMFVATLLFLTIQHTTDAQIPSNPCPAIFNYHKSETEGIFGSITFNNDLSGLYDLEINMTVPINTRENIEIRRRTSDFEVQRGGALRYFVIFPKNLVPKLMSVTFNNQLYCYGPPSEGLVVTTLSRRNILQATKPQNFNNKPQSSSQIVQNFNPKPQSFDQLSLQPSFPQSSSKFSPSPFTQPIITRPFSNAPITRKTTQPPLTVTNREEDEFKLETNNNRCGINRDFQPLVFAGNVANNGDYPWLVAMFYLTRRAYNFRCAGSLISTRHVVTAAHCIRREGKSDINREDVLIVMGKHNLKHWATQSTIKGVVDFLVHPDYKGPGDADVALVVLDGDVEFSSRVRALCLWDEADQLERIVGSSGVVAGWGRDETGRDFVDEPAWIEMPVVSQETCLRSDDRFLKLTSARTFCAGNRNGSTPCTGDSGGGFIIKRGGKWKLRGVVSVALLDAGTRSCDANHYVVFSDVPKYKPWLTKAMRQT